MASMTEPKPHILIVDDDDRLSALLKKFLSGQGFMVYLSPARQRRKRGASWRGLFSI